MLAALACAVPQAASAQAASAQAASAQADTIQVVGEQKLSPRMSQLTVRSSVLPADVVVRVILPVGYDASPSRRYPVVYLLPGTNNTPATLTDNMDVEAFSARYPVIVVIPFGGLGSYYTDWFNGGAFGPPKWETYHLGQLIPLLDARYRTIADRSGRSIMGISMGGFGSISYAARHPDLFAAAVSLSGAVNTDYAPQIPVVTASALLDSGAPDAQFGPRATQEVRWRGHNPWDLAVNLRGLDLQLLAHTGQPGGPHGSNLDPLEYGIHEEGLELHDQLTALGIPHAWIDLGAGAHNWPEFQDEIHIALPHVIGVAHPPPAPDPFTFVAIEPQFSVWGWTFAADPRRALEFLRVQDAGAGGLTLVGSGTTTVTTAPLFAGARSVDVIQHGQTRTVTPDRSGRITFTVDLGPPHQIQQFTVPTGAVGQSPVRTSVRFVPRSSGRHTHVRDNVHRRWRPRRHRHRTRR